jgi:hypothetical protein
MIFAQGKKEKEREKNFDFWATKLKKTCGLIQAEFDSKNPHNAELN